MTAGLWVALGSALGGAARYWISGLVARRFGETFPWGTLLVNVSGCLLAGLVFALTAPDGRLLLGSSARQFVMLGVLGGYTTFSSFSVQTLTLVQDGEWASAALNAAGSVVLCLGAVLAGFMLGTAVNR